MPRGVPNYLTDNPEYGICWCGKRFRKKHPDQIHCSPWHRSLASYHRAQLRVVPPPARPAPRRKRAPSPPPPSPPPGFLESK